MIKISLKNILKKTFKKKTKPKIKKIKSINTNKVKKIKTIGDAYMCVGGIEKNDSSHAKKVCVSALDMIRFVELSGNLTYNTSLIIRALKVANVATSIQGDSTGTKVGAGSNVTNTTAWDSGELIIQTRNASFGLVYAGSVDIEGSANAQTIPPSLRGWWLMEL